MRSITHEMLATPYDVEPESLSRYNWETQTRFLQKLHPIQGSYTTYLGSDTGTKTTSKGKMFSDDEDKD